MLLSVRECIWREYYGRIGIRVRSGSACYSLYTGTRRRSKRVCTIIKKYTVLVTFDGAKSRYFGTEHLPADY